MGVKGKRRIVIVFGREGEESNGALEICDCVWERRGGATGFGVLAIGLAVREDKDCSSSCL